MVIKQKIPLISFFILATSLLTYCHTARPDAAPVPGSGGSDKLFASKWSLREVEGLTLMPSTVGKEAYLLFSAGKVNMVSGSTGCNSLKGSVELGSAQKIRFSPLATTRMACPPDGNNTEQRFLSALQKADNYVVTDEGLVLLNGTEIISRLVATPISREPGK